MMVLTALEKRRGRITQRVGFRLEHRRVLHVRVVGRVSVREVASQHRGASCSRLQVAGRYRASHGGGGTRL